MQKLDIQDVPSKTADVLKDHLKSDPYHNRISKDAAKLADAGHGDAHYQGSNARSTIWQLADGTPYVLKYGDSVEPKPETLKHKSQIVILVSSAENSFDRRDLESYQGTTITETHLQELRASNVAVYELSDFCERSNDELFDIGDVFISHANYEGDERNLPVLSRALRQSLYGGRVAFLEKAVGKFIIICPEGSKNASHETFRIFDGDEVLVTDGQVVKRRQTIIRRKPA